MIAIIGVWASSFAVYLVLAGQASTDEVVAGAVCAAAAVLWWMATRRVCDHAFAFDVDALAAAGRGCRRVPVAVLVVGGILLRAIIRRGAAGRVDTRFFAHGRRADPGDAGRRAVGVLAASLASDSVVLRTPPDRDEIVVHALGASAPPGDPRWPI